MNYGFNIMKKMCCWCVSIVMVMILFNGTTYAQSSEKQPTATVSKVSGNVFGITSESGRVKASVGMVLKGSDSIETQQAAQATLTLSEGSTIQLGEETQMKIAALIRDQVTGARVSRVNLLAGRMRASLSDGHQQQGAAFTVNTPNAMADVKFSQPLIEVRYDPDAEITIIEAFTVDVTVTHLRTNKVELLPQGNQAIVGETIEIAPISTERLDEVEQETEAALEGPTTSQMPPFARIRLFDEVQQNAGAASGRPTIGQQPPALQIRGVVTQITGGTIPSSHAETSQNPPPGGTPNRPDRHQRPVTVNLQEGGYKTR